MVRNEGGEPLSLVCHKQFMIPNLRFNIRGKVAWEICFPFFLREPFFPDD
jgi:hypothetical protein